MKKTLFSKKTIFFLSVFFVLALGFQYALANDFNGLKVGSRSEIVKNLQEALKGDSSIYPEGLTTGYFGTLTKKAIEKVQARCGLLETGTVDENTVKCIFPVDYRVVVSSPNGGEVWNRGEINIIKWIVAVPDYADSKNGKKIMPPIWSKASIDLFEKKLCRAEICPAVEPRSVFVKHLATVNLFDGSYSWKVDNNIANGSDYVVRITVGPSIMPMYLYEKGQKMLRPDIWPTPSGNWDESDNPFTIEGKIVPPQNTELKELLEILQQVSAQIARAIQLLNQIISNQ